MVLQSETVLNSIEICFIYIGFDVFTPVTEKSSISTVQFAENQHVANIIRLEECYKKEESLKQAASSNFWNLNTFLRNVG